MKSPIVIRITARVRVIYGYSEGFFSRLIALGGFDLNMIVIITMVFKVSTFKVSAVPLRLNLPLLPTIVKLAPSLLVASVIVLFVCSGIETLAVVIRNASSTVTVMVFSVVSIMSGKILAFRVALILT
ncbi:hypothetical protein BSPWISOXPB_5635 [uncultured Gammaproteobacteria bacterium]|nr:hypothetical protein BSPWISOXPB_5635 [uncultured Gammaproteobacteria bacterium]